MHHAAASTGSRNSTPGGAAAGTPGGGFPTSFTPSVYGAAMALRGWTPGSAAGGGGPRHLELLKGVKGPADGDFFATMEEELREEHALELAALHEAFNKEKAELVAIAERAKTGAHAQRMSHEDEVKRLTEETAAAKAAAANATHDANARFEMARTALMQERDAHGAAAEEAKAKAAREVEIAKEAWDRERERLKEAVERARAGPVADAAVAARAEAERYADVLLDWEKDREEWRRAQEETKRVHDAEKEDLKKLRDQEVAALRAEADARSKAWIDERSKLVAENNDRVEAIVARHDLEMNALRKEKHDVLEDQKAQFDNILKQHESDSAAWSEERVELISEHGKHLESVTARHEEDKSRWSNERVELLAEIGNKLEVLNQRHVAEKALWEKERRDILAVHETHIERANETHEAAAVAWRKERAELLAESATREDVIAAKHEERAGGWTTERARIIAEHDARVDAMTLAHEKATRAHDERHRAELAAVEDRCRRRNDLMKEEHARSATLAKTASDAAVAKARLEASVAANDAASKRDAMYAKWALERERIDAEAEATRVVFATELAAAKDERDAADAAAVEEGMRREKAEAERSVAESAATASRTAREEAERNAKTWSGEAARARHAAETARIDAEAAIRVAREEMELELAQLREAHEVRVAAAAEDLQRERERDAEANAHAQRAAEEGVAAALEEAATTVRFAREDAASKIAEKERAFKTTLLLRAWRTHAAFEAGPRRASLGRDCLRAWAAASPSPLDVPRADKCYRSRLRMRSLHAWIRVCVVKAAARERADAFTARRDVLRYLNAKKKALRVWRAVTRYESGVRTAQARVRSKNRLARLKEFLRAWNAHLKVTQQNEANCDRFCDRRASYLCQRILKSWRFEVCGRRIENGQLELIRKRYRAFIQKRIMRQWSVVARESIVESHIMKSYWKRRRRGQLKFYLDRWRTRKQQHRRMTRFETRARKFVVTRYRTAAFHEWRLVARTGTRHYVAVERFKQRVAWRHKKTTIRLAFHAWHTLLASDAAVGRQLHDLYYRRASRRMRQSSFFAWRRAARQTNAAMDTMRRLYDSNLTTKRVLRPWRERAKALATARRAAISLLHKRQRPVLFRCLYALRNYASSWRIKRAAVEGMRVRSAMRREVTLVSKSFVSWCTVLEESKNHLRHYLAFRRKSIMALVFKKWFQRMMGEKLGVSLAGRLRVELEASQERNLRRFAIRAMQSWAEAAAKEVTYRKKVRSFRDWRYKRRVVQAWFARVVAASNFHAVVHNIGTDYKLTQHVHLITAVFCAWRVLQKTCADAALVGARRFHERRERSVLVLTMERFRKNAEMGRAEGAIAFAHFRLVFLAWRRLVASSKDKARKEAIADAHKAKKLRFRLRMALKVWRVIKIGAASRWEHARAEEARVEEEVARKNRELEEEVARKERVAETNARRLASRTRAKAFFAWHRVGVVLERKIASFKDRALMRAVVRDFRAWHLAVTLLPKLEKEEAKKRALKDASEGRATKCLLRMTRRRNAMALQSWRDFSTHRARHRLVANRMVLRHLTALAARAVREWRLFASNAARTRDAAIEHALSSQLRRMRMNLIIAMSTWRFFVRERKNDERIADVVIRIHHRSERGKAFKAWRVETSRLQSVRVTAVKALFFHHRHVLLRHTVDAWTEYVARVRADKNAIAERDRLSVEATKEEALAAVAAAAAAAERIAAEAEADRLAAEERARATKAAEARVDGWRARRAFYRLREVLRAWRATTALALSRRRRHARSRVSRAFHAWRRAVTVTPLDAKRYERRHAVAVRHRDRAVMRQVVAALRRRARLGAALVAVADESFSVLKAVLLGRTFGAWAASAALLREKREAFNREVAEACASAVSEAAEARAEATRVVREAERAVVEAEAAAAAATATNFLATDRATSPMVAPPPTPPPPPSSNARELETELAQAKAEVRRYRDELAEAKLDAARIKADADATMLAASRRASPTRSPSPAASPSSSSPRPSPRSGGIFSLAYGDEFDAEYGAFDREPPREPVLALTPPEETTDTPRRAEENYQSAFLQWRERETELLDRIAVAEAAAAAAEVKTAEIVAEKRAFASTAPVDAKVFDPDSTPPPSPAAPTDLFELQREGYEADLAQNKAMVEDAVRSAEISKEALAVVEAEAAADRASYARRFEELAKRAEDAEAAATTARREAAAAAELLEVERAAAAAAKAAAEQCAVDVDSLSDALIASEEEIKRVGAELAAATRASGAAYEATDAAEEATRELARTTEYVADLESRLAVVTKRKDALEEEMVDVRADLRDKTAALEDASGAARDAATRVAAAEAAETTASAELAKAHESASTLAATLASKEKEFEVKLDEVRADARAEERALREERDRLDVALTATNDKLETAEARCVDLAAQVNVWVKRGMKLVNIKEGDAGEENENVVNAIGTPGWYASMGSGVEAATRMADAAVAAASPSPGAAAAAPAPASAPAPRRVSFTPTPTPKRRPSESTPRPTPQVSIPITTTPDPSPTVATAKVVSAMESAASDGAVERVTAALKESADRAAEAEKQLAEVLLSEEQSDAKYEKRIASLKRKVVDLTNEVNDLNAELHASKEKVSLAEKREKSSRTKLAATEKKLSESTQAAIDKAAAEKTAAAKAATRAWQSTAKSSADAKHAGGKLDSAVETIALLSGEIESARGREAELAARCAAVEADLRVARGELKSSGVAALEKRLAACAEQITSLQALVDAVPERIADAVAAETAALRTRANDAETTANESVRLLDIARAETVAIAATRGSALRGGDLDDVLTSAKALLREMRERRDPSGEIESLRAAIQEKEAAAKALTAERDDALAAAEKASRKKAPSVPIDPADVPAALAAALEREEGLMKQITALRAELDDAARSEDSFEEAAEISRVDNANKARAEKAEAELRQAKAALATLADERAGMGLLGNGGVAASPGRRGGGGGGGEGDESELARRLSAALKERDAARALLAESQKREESLRATLRDIKRDMMIAAAETAAASARLTPLKAGGGDENENENENDAFASPTLSEGRRARRMSREEKASGLRRGAALGKWREVSGAGTEPGPTVIGSRGSRPRRPRAERERGLARATAQLEDMLEDMLTNRR